MPEQIFSSAGKIVDNITFVMVIATIIIVLFFVLAEKIN